MSRSEDLAQETFVSAWKQLAELREPAKLRPWLCSIARSLISKEFRRQGREPDHAAESLEAVDEWVSPEPLPRDQVISDEEKAILWRSLERIPEIYREPLVLFYREQQSPHPYVPTFNASLFLSATQTDVKEAIDAGLPAGLVIPTSAKDDDSDKELRIAFDFDGVIADDEAEAVYRKQDLEHFQDLERRKSTQPHNPGPLKDLITKIAFFQKIEAKRAKQLPGYKPLLRIAIVTARNAPAHERLITTLNDWKISAAETFFLGGIEKGRVLNVLKPHIFFDDQLGHLIPTAASVPSVHIPFGIANRPPSAPRPTLEAAGTVDGIRAGI